MMPFCAAGSYGSPIPDNSIKCTLLMAYAHSRTTVAGCSNSSPFEQIRIGDAGDALAVAVLEHLGDPRMGAQLEIRIAHGNRDHSHMRAALGVGFAAEALAIAAILAGTEFCSVWIGVRLRRVC